MTTTQKIIKYCALAFALCLIAGIFSAILQGARFIGESLFGESAKMDKYVYLVEEADPVKYESKKLVIEASATNIKIVKGTAFTVRTNNKNINYYPDDEELTIKEKNKRSFNIGSIDTELIIELPQIHPFEKIEIEAGAGKINIQDLKVDKLELEQGAGSVYMKNVEVTKTTNIDGGAGSITIEETTMSNIKLNIGTGSFKYNGYLTGINNIDCGVGSTTLNLKGDKKDYQLHLEKGVGSIKVDGEKVSNDKTIGNGANTIDIDGGVGSITINFTK